jgi:hypothetical protein
LFDPIVNAFDRADILLTGRDETNANAGHFEDPGKENTHDNRGDHQLWKGHALF